MSTTYEIPLQPNAQTLRISLAGVYYNLTVLWNNLSLNWNVDIADDSFNNILTGVPLVVGSDLLQQYGYLNFGGQLIAYVDIDSSDNDNDIDNFESPSYDDLGQTGHLYFIVP